MWREPLPQAFGRRDSSSDYERRGGGGLRTGGRRDSFQDDRYRDDRRWDDGPGRWEYASRSPPRRRSRSRSPPRGRSRSPRRDWHDRSRDFGRDRRDDRDDKDDRYDRDDDRDDRGWRNDVRRSSFDSRFDSRGGGPMADWQRHLNPANTDEGDIVQVAGCIVRAPAVVVDFWMALEMGILKRVEELLPSADVNERGGPYGSTPLGWAAFTGDTTLAKLLLNHSADPNLPAKKGSYPLHMASWNGDHVEIVEILVAAGAKTDVRNRNGETPLEQAQWFDKLERESLIEQVYHLDDWRQATGKARAGRSAIIQALAAVEPGGQPSEQRGATDKEQAKDAQRAELSSEQPGEEAAAPLAEDAIAAEKNDHEITNGSSNAKAEEDPKWMDEMEVEDDDEVI